MSGGSAYIGHRVPLPAEAPAWQPSDTHSACVLVAGGREGLRPCFSCHFSSGLALFGSGVSGTCEESAALL